MIYLLFGPPGSGKGTQSEQLSKNLGFEHLSTGDMFRKHLKEETPLGLEAKGFINKGELVPDELVIGMVREELKGLENQQVILDGFPRTLEQGKALKTLAEQENQKISSVIYLNVEKDILLQRLTGRRVCSSCGTAFHVLYRKPKQEKVCDACGGELMHRKDDQEEVIQNRLSVYAEQTEPLLDFYRQEGLLKEVSGQGSSEEVFERIKGILA